MSCYSENDYTNVPNKNVVGFDGFVDGLVAQTAILGQLSKTLIPLNEEAANLAKERVRFIVKNMAGDFLTRLLNPIDILSGEEAASMDALFGAGLFFEMKEGPAKLKVQGHYFTGRVISTSPQEDLRVFLGFRFDEMSMYRFSRKIRELIQFVKEISTLLEKHKMNELWRDTEQEPKFPEIDVRERIRFL